METNVYNICLRFIFYICQSHKISILENMLLKLRFKPLKQRARLAARRVVKIKNSTSFLVIWPLLRFACLHLKKRTSLTPASRNVETVTKPNPAGMKRN